MENRDETLFLYDFDKTNNNNIILTMLTNKVAKY